MPGDSMNIGLSGLDAYQTQIDTVSNNIANVGTTGYKGQRTTFQDLLYQEQGYPSAPTSTLGGTNPIETGLGVKVGTTDTNFLQGGLQTTGVNTDLAINGDGFFMLQNVSGSGQPAYTRDGAFSFNQNGVLYDPSSGLAVQGYVANSAGKITATGVPQTIEIPLGTKSEAVGTGFGTKFGSAANDKVFDATFGGNLDQSQWAKEATGVAGTPSTPGLGLTTTVSTTIYDSLGNSHLATFTYTPDATGYVSPTTTGLPATLNDAQGNAHAPATRWKVSVSFSDGTQVGGASSATLGYAFFDQNGQYINSSQSANGATTHVAGSAPAATAGDLMNITSWGTGNNAVAPTGTATLAAVGLDYSLMSSLAGAYSANTLAQNGYGEGTLSNISIASDGTISGAFSNGQSQVLGQVALVSFQNEEGLVRAGGSQFHSSASSGLPQLGVAGTGKFGTIVSGSLEQSNVSLADEFTKLITAQNAFQANSKTITTANENMQTVLQIVR